ncbi:MAG: DUF1016 family protein [Methylococcaceae bacterium]|nr:MAG: DUF1016 family protein [Methylococcaceae bacterium]
MSKDRKTTLNGRDQAGNRKTSGRSKPDVLFPAPDALAKLPAEYGTFFSEIKAIIARERIKAVMSANAAMVLMYWDIGQSILQRQRNEGWGARVIDRLAHDLKTTFPEMTGFSARNLKYMRQFCEAWPDRAIVQRTVALLPWRSNLTLLEKLGDPEIRLWYAEKALELGMGKDMLAIQIESRLHERQGKALSNFHAVLPPTESDMTAQVFKDPYLFDFLGTADPRREAELEQKLVDHIQQFLLALGQGFAFVGRQVHLEIGDKDKNQMLVEYALAGTTKPIGVAQWERQITQSLPDNLKPSLPSVEDIEAELARGEP